MANVAGADRTRDYRGSATQIALTGFALGLGACGSEALPVSAQASAASGWPNWAVPTADATATCDPVQMRPDGVCCPTGSFFEASSPDGCLAVGPPECASTILAAPEKCVPRWCQVWVDQKGVTCGNHTSLCHVVGQLCDGKALAAGQGCEAGQWRDPDGGACVPAGLPGDATAMAKWSGLAQDLPPLATPTWCWDLIDADDKPCDLATEGCLPRGRSCSRAELAMGAGCLAGHWPNPRKGGACVPAGVPDAVGLTPLWCAAWRFADGTACKPTENGCAYADVPCIPGVTPCLAGQWFSAEANQCLPAGAIQPADVPLLQAAADKLSPPPPLPPIRWCHDYKDIAGSPCTAGAYGCLPTGRRCSWAEKVAGAGCAVGTVPENGKCIAAGVPWLCPSGFQAAAGSAGTGPVCVPASGDCGVGPYGAAIGAQIIFVDQSYSGVSAGTADKPYSTIEAALSAAPSGSTVAVAAGNYPENLVISKPVNLVGRCAALVTLTSLGTAVALRVVAVKGVTLARFAVTGGGPGIQVEAGADAKCEQLWLHDVTGFGVSAAGVDAQAEITSTVIDHVFSKVSDASGAAVASLGGRLLVSDLAIQAAVPNGLVATGLSSSVLGRRIRVTGQSGQPKPGTNFGIVAIHGASMTVVHAGVFGLTGFGIMAQHAGEFAGAGLAVEDVTPGLGGAGRGLFVHGAGRLSAYGTAVGTVTGAACEASGTDSKFTCTGCAVHHTAAISTLNASTGLGLLAGLGAEANLLASAFADNQHTAAKATGIGTKVRGGELDVLRTTDKVTPGAVLAHGLEIQTGALLTLQQSRIMGNSHSGIVVEGGKLAATGVLCAGNGWAILTDKKFTSKSPISCGILASNQAKVAVSGSRLTHNALFGVLAWHASTEVTVVGALIDHPIPTLVQLDSRGANAAQGASMRVIASRLTRHQQFGIGVFFKAFVWGDRVVVDTPMPPTGGFSGAVRADNGSRIRLAASRIVGHHRGLEVAANCDGHAAGLAIEAGRSGTQSIGLYVLDQAKLELAGAVISAQPRHGVSAIRAQLAAAGLLLVNGLPGETSPDLFQAVSVAAFKDAVIDLTACRLSGNRGQSINAGGSGTEVRLQDCTVDNTLYLALPPSAGIKHVDMGVAALEGAIVDLRRSRVSGNVSQGLYVSGVGSTLRGIGCVIDDTTSEIPIYGSGGTAMLSGLLDLQGSVVTGNGLAGLVAFGAGSAVRGFGLRVTDNKVNSAGHYSAGVAALSGGRLDVTASVLADNLAGGVALYEGTGTLRNTVVSRTRSGSSITLDGQQATFGDGVQCYKVSGISVTQSAIIGNGRAGVLLSGCPLAQLTGTLVAHNTVGLGTEASGLGSNYGAVLYLNTQQNKVQDANFVVPAPPFSAP